MRLRRAVEWCVLAIAACGAARGQGIQCVGNAAQPSLVRNEGTAEKIADMVLACFGGNAGDSVTVNLSVFFTVPVAAPVNAIAVINEPRGALEFGVNAFHGTIAGANQVRFQVTVPAPGNGPTLIIRLAGIRL